MAQFYYINQGAVLPTLRMEIVEDGKHDYHKFMEAVQSANITFTMVNADTNITKVAKAKAYIKLRENDDCTEQYVICYDWKAHDTKEAGTYIGTFDIDFSGDLKNDEYTYPKGLLKVPLREPLYIIIQPNIK